MKRVLLVLLLSLLVSLLPVSCGSGGGLANLTHNPRTEDKTPSWSPDGGRIIFVSVTRTEPSNGMVPPATDYGIYVMDANGANRSKLLPICPWSLSWSPDGSRIVFTGEYGSVTSMDTDGSNVTAVVTGMSVYVYADSPSYSPGGSKIMFAASRGKGWQIFVVDTDGSHETCLSPPDVRDMSPAWSPDGTQIAFESERDRPSGIYVMNADGGNPRRLTDSKVSSSYPTWSPDGKRIAFVSKRDGKPEIYIMDADGSNVARLTDNDIAEVNPKWSPEGTKIVFSGWPPPDTAGPPDIYTVTVPA